MVFEKSELVNLLKFGGMVMIKSKIVLSFMVMLSLISSIQAADYTYSWCFSSGNWADSTMWHDVSPSPSLLGCAIIYNGATLNVTTTGQGAHDAIIGYEPGVPAGPVNVNVMAGADWTITSTLQISDRMPGVLNVYGTANCYYIRMGLGTTGDGTINVYNGGSMNVGAAGIEIGMSSGTAKINLKGGTMTVAAGNGISMTALGHIDIEAGTLLIAGDSEGQILYYTQDYINNGWITGYGGAAELIVNVDPTTYEISITAPNPPVATISSPADGQRKVALNTTLSWTGGTTLHDVYFGTNATSVANANHASSEYKGRQTATTYNPGTLVAGQGYYWRIDEFDGTNAWKGTVWSFATERTAPIVFTRGITLDRQFSTIPPEAHNKIDDSDVALIKRMGFNFAKVLVNPAPMISGSTINTTNMAYVDEIVNVFLNQNIPVVVCIHPEPGFKTTYLGSAGGFTTLLSFYHDFAGYLAARWGVNEVAFQLMTEPFGNYTDWNTMLPQLVSSVRSAMPNNTLIVSGANSGKISGLTALTQACVDAIGGNVYYGFTYWDESNLLPFLFQGGGLVDGYQYLKNVPYPSNTTNNPADYIMSTIPSGQYASVLAAVTAYCNTPWNMTTQRNVLQPIVDWKTARGGNLNVICYEMGVPIDPCQSTTHGGVLPADRIQYIHDKRLALEEKNIGWTYWSYNETFTVLNYPLRVAFEKNITKDKISPETLTALGMPCGCGCAGEPPAGDLNKDCHINFSDFAVLVSSWLDCTEPTDTKCQ
jgi:hypothetical protein